MNPQEKKEGVRKIRPGGRRESYGKVGGLPAWLSSENAICDKQSRRLTERQINYSTSHLASCLREQPTL